MSAQLLSPSSGLCIRHSHYELPLSLTRGLVALRTLTYIQNIHTVGREALSFDMDSPLIHDADTIYEFDGMNYYGLRRAESHISDNVFTFEAPSEDIFAISEANDTDSHEEFVSDEICDICLVKHTEAIQFSLDMHAEWHNYEPPHRDPSDLLSRPSLFSRSTSPAIMTPPSGTQSSANSNVGPEDLEHALATAQEQQKPRRKIAFAFDIDDYPFGSMVPTAT